MKLINIARSILVIGYVMLVSCSSDEGGESGNGPQATGQELNGNSWTHIGNWPKKSK